MADTTVAEETGGRKIAPIIAGIGFLVAAAFVVMLIVAGPKSGETAETPLLHQVAPSAVGENADGSPFRLSHRKGSWVVINFFNTTCIPCIQEHPELVEFVEQQRSLGSEGAEFYAIVVDSTRDEVEEFFDQYGGDWPAVYDTDYDFSSGFGVARQPETWVIDPNGIVRDRVIGAIPDGTAFSARLQQIREALA